MVKITDSTVIQGLQKQAGIRVNVYDALGFRGGGFWGLGPEAWRKERGRWWLLCSSLFRAPAGSVFIDVFQQEQRPMRRAEGSAKLAVLAVGHSEIESAGLVKPAHFKSR